MTNYLSRVIYKGRSSLETDFSGTYRLLVAAKSIPAPYQPRNAVEKTTMEDSSQVFDEGIFQSGQKEFTGNLDIKELQKINAVKGEADIIQLYGTDGIGGQGKFAYTGKVSASPSDTSGTDGVLEMTVTATPTSSVVECTDLYTVVDNGDSTFTVTKVS